MEELNFNELENISGGLYNMTRRILDFIGQIAGEMNNKIHEDAFWWSSFAH